ncbi:MAG: type II toxin-antitoxin system YafQ family toxin [Anaerolineaceae bacterium]
MKKIRQTSQFKRDAKRMKKRGMDIKDYIGFFTDLVNGTSLAPKFSDHPLEGQYEGARECHLKPDWLLIYESTKDELILIRTGSHADLFK